MIFFDGICRRCLPVYAGLAFSAMDLHCLFPICFYSHKNIRIKKYLRLLKNLPCHDRINIISADMHEN